MTQQFAIADVVPHAKPMCLLDNIVSYTAESLLAEVTIRSDSPFCENGAVPAYVGIEYMGQAVAAFAGICSRLEGTPVQVGFLVGARKLVSSVSEFNVGSCLRVGVERIADEVDGLSVFACEITGHAAHSDAQAHDVTVTANLNVYCPADVEQYFEEL